MITDEARPLRPSASDKLIERMAKTKPEPPKMKHRGVEYGVEEDRPGLWRWIIYPKVEHGPQVIGPARFKRRDDAVEGCIEEINNTLERLLIRKRPPG